MRRGAAMEIQSLLDGLGGYFVPPGPSGAPSRGRLDTLPTGRNFFSVDNRAIPSPAAWSLGEKSARAFVERYLQDNGDFPRRLGLSVWGTATMRTGGDDIAQAFALMGVRPIWSLGSQRVIDVEVIPAMRLQRPRVDVTLRVSGFFRDAFPNVIRLFDAAVQALAGYEEPGSDNGIRAAVTQRRQALEAQGLPADVAAREARYRVFGSKPGAYGTGLNRLIDGRAWDGAHDLAQAYLRAGAYAYGQFPESGIAARDAFEHQLTGLQAVMQNQDNREHDILDSNTYYAFQGGMANASRVLGGRAPAIYHADHANPAQPRIRTLKEELNRVIRSRVLNPKWIEAMREHGYKGAFEMAATVDYLFAYDATTDLVADYQYAQVSEALVLDPANQRFLRAHNAAALEEMAECLLEAAQRGLWQDPGAQGAALQDLLLEIDEARETGTATGGTAHGG
jgi:cobaltochelatase CobN